MSKNNRARGQSRAVVGKVKEGVGKLIGNEQLEADGKREVLRGEAEDRAAKTAEQVVGAGEQVSGSVKHALGETIGSPALVREGDAETRSGQRRQRNNR